MTEEASLTDFAGSEDGDEQRGRSAVDDADADLPADPDPSSPEPARATYAWAPEATCGACGESVDRRWRDGDRFVCAACKDW